MKKIFSDKYKYYCKVRETHDAIFCMTQKANETLEDYVERFQFSYKHATNFKLDDESLKLVFLRGVRRFNIRLRFNCYKRYLSIHV